MNLAGILVRVAALLAIVTVVNMGPTAAQAKEVRDLKPTIILISLDGFRWDYPQKYSPPAINKLIQNGVRAKWMIPSFPTKTFPNHYTVVTGLYPQNHGIVENNVFDFGTVFSMSKREEVENPRWWGGEPIWVTAEKQGQRAASYFWVGSETGVEELSPSKWRIYNGRVPNIMRVDKVLGWLDLPAAERPTMMTMYFSTTDDVGHEFGPDSEETRYGVLEVDGYIERLMNGLKIRGLENKVNVIITSDHGMAAYYPRNATFLDEHFDFDLTERILWTNEIVQIFPKTGKLDEIYGKVKGLDHVTCWKKGEIPARLHYNDGKRVAPIVCSSEIGWITTSRKRWDDWYSGLDDVNRPRGAHGYDNRYPEMQATFIAHGPAFKKGFVAEPFENIHVYELMCRILGLKPAPNDGSLDRVRGVLR
ncbi:MAG: ectonucleotide pyrophosphatase/phosphodiesterase [Pyrinomonadaceae bacterium]